MDLVSKVGSTLIYNKVKRTYTDEKSKAEY